MKLLVFSILTLTILSAETPTAPPKPAPVITDKQKLALKDLEAQVWKIRVELTAKQADEQKLLNQYQKLFDEAQTYCGDKFNLSNDLVCVSKPPVVAEKKEPAK